MEVSINVNVSVIAHLTPAGLVHLRANYRELGWSADKPIPGLDGNVLRTQLWDLMAIFGPQMYMGNPQVMFEQNQVYLDMGPH